MAKYKIRIETKQLWEMTTKAKDNTQAEQIKNNFYNHITEQIKTSVGNPISDGYKLIEQWCNDTDTEIINLDLEAIPEAEGGSRCASYLLSLNCPHCGREVEYRDYETEYARIIDEIDKKQSSIVICSECDKEFRQTYYKNY